MSVWNRQDWAWRVAVIVGLIFVLAVVVDAHATFAFMSLWGPSSHTPESTWRFDHTVSVGKYYLVFVVCWLGMLKWRWGALPWGIGWLSATVGVVYVMVWGELSTPIESAAEFLRLPTAAGLCASQLWVAWEAHTGSAGSPRSFRSQSREKGSQVRDRASLMWLFVAVCGEIALLGCAVLVSAHCLTPGPLMPHDPFQSIVNCSGLVITGIFAVNAIVVFISMTVSGRGWLWWALLWAVCLPGFVAALVGKAGWGMALVLLAISQIWVALRARRLQLEQAAGSEALEA